jgi:hypothetical protein
MFRVGAAVMTNKSPDLHAAFERWNRRQLSLIAIGFPILFAAIFSAMFFGLGHGN